MSYHIFWRLTWCQQWCWQSRTAVSERIQFPIGRESAPHGPRCPHRCPKVTHTDRPGTKKEKHEMSHYNEQRNMYKSPSNSSYTSVYHSVNVYEPEENKNICRKSRTDEDVWRHVSSFKHDSVSCGISSRFVCTNTFCLSGLSTVLILAQYDSTELKTVKPHRQTDSNRKRVEQKYHLYLKFSCCSGFFLPSWAVNSTKLRDWEITVSDCGVLYIILRACCGEHITHCLTNYNSLNKGKPSDLNNRE